MAATTKKKSKTKKDMESIFIIPGASRFSKSTLDKVYKRSQGAFFSSWLKTKTSQHSWAMGRVKSFVSGKGGARKASLQIY